MIADIQFSIDNLIWWLGGGMLVISFFTSMSNSPSSSDGSLQDVHISPDDFSDAVMSGHDSDSWMSSTSSNSSLFKDDSIDSSLFSSTEDDTRGDVLPNRESLASMFQQDNEFLGGTDATEAELLMSGFNKTMMEETAGGDLLGSLTDSLEVDKLVSIDLEATLEVLKSGTISTESEIVEHDRTGVSDKSLLSLVERDNNFDVNNDILSVFTGHEISEDSPRSSDDVSLGSDVFSDVNDPFFAQGESTTAAIAATSGASLDSKLDLARAYIDIGDHEAADTLLNEVFSEGDANMFEKAAGLKQLMLED